MDLQVSRPYQPRQLLYKDLAMPLTSLVQDTFAASFEEEQEELITNCLEVVRLIWRRPISSVPVRYI